MAASKVDMTLDQIIKLQSKKKRSSGGAGPSNPRGKRGRGGGRGAGARGKGGRGAGGARLTSDFQPRRSLRTNTGQRLAQNLVKRAMLGSRRQAIAGRRRMSNGVGGQLASNPPGNQRLAQEVRKWRSTARSLQNQLQNQRRTPRLNVNAQRRRGRGRANFKGAFSTRKISPLRNRLGWTNSSPTRGNFSGRADYPAIDSGARGRGRRARGSDRVARVIAGRPVGQMRSDLISREQARERKLAADLLALAESQMLIASRGSTQIRRSGGRAFPSFNRPNNSFETQPRSSRGSFSPNNRRGLFNNRRFSRRTVNFGGQFSNQNQPEVSSSGNFNRQQRLGNLRTGPKQFGRRGKRGSGAQRNFYR